MSTQPLIETERMTLRPLRGADAGLIALYGGDERVARMTTSIPHPLPPGAAEALIERAGVRTRSETIWAMDATKIDGSELIGLISVEHGVETCEEVGFWVGPPFWNTGYGTEALAGLIGHRFEAGIPRLLATVFQDNPQSAQVLLHCEFEYVGDGERFSVSRNAVVPQWRYVLEAETWQRRDA
jgi:RimJ/RimL family protein N-acetyltransferase